MRAIKRSRRPAALPEASVLHHRLQRKCARSQPRTAGRQRSSCVHKQHVLPREPARAATIAATRVGAVWRFRGRPLDGSGNTLVEWRFDHELCSPRAHADRKATESGHPPVAWADTVESATL